MASHSCSFIIIPDASSECKRFTVSKSLIWGFLASAVLVIFLIGGVLYVMISEYRAMAMKAGQLDKLKKISVSQKNTIDRYEQDITQLSKHLAHIQQLNSRLMVLSGLDPAQNNDGKGIGGGDELESSSEEVNTGENGELLETEP
ncbi:hypothetical protein U14_01980 [Candidatus Moduliflexus flocculans]|uniref:Uncharacterized protein n=1 Tax=Candidatus Moduliflexus flocculans TaxID=1499966 RepID=A0A0S6VT94_9BACT|nr:hypothetical protein U14_01980 [Candidatus Moduliflexus flocculans]